jgi:DNA-binding CsgD family transcriptional regulator
MPTPTAVEITLSNEERDRLKAWSRRPKTAQALALRSRIVLAAAEGLTNLEIAEREGVSRPTVTKWRRRFADQRLEVCWTSRGRDGPGRSPTRRSSGS